MKEQVKKVVPDPSARWWDLLAGLLLLCALLTAATRLVVTQWTEELYLIQTLTFIGVILGLALGQSRLNHKVSILVAIGYGLILIPWHLGQSMHHTIGWQERLTIMGQRLGETIYLISRSNSVNDNLLFLLLMSILFWFLSIYSAYSLTRRGAAWRGMVPVGLAVIVIHAYDPLIIRRGWFLAAFLLFALLLVARTHFVQQRYQWKQNRTYIPPDIGFDWIRFTLGAAVLLITFAWTAPALADTLPAARSVWRTIKQPWDEFSDRASNLFDSLQSSVAVVQEYYGNEFTLGTGTELTDSRILTVQTPYRSLPGTRYYWRALSFDRYENGQWINTFEDSEFIEPNAMKLPIPNYEGRELATFSFTPTNSIVTLYTPPEPVSISIAANAEFASNPDNTVDVAAFQASSFVPRGYTYEVTALVSTMSENQLREAGTDYPDYILERYLQLPESITPRTHELAQSISGDLENPYDIAVAVTNYLRTYEYRETISPPPDDQDIVDWWLFDYQTGFCQYYASAHVVLLRSLGIPARMVAGYAQGEYAGRSGVDQDNDFYLIPDDYTDEGGIYHVRQRDAHTWPEVYFPGYGWVEFEPTASLTNIIRPRDDADSLHLLDEDDPRSWRGSRLDDLLGVLPDDFFPDMSDPGAASFVDDPSSRSPFIWYFYPSVFGAVLIVLMLWRNRERIDLNFIPIQLERGMKRAGIKPPKFIERWSYQASLSPLMKSYMEINKALRRLGKEPELNDTPAERGIKLANILPAAEGMVMSLVKEYHLSTYSKRSPNQAIAREAGKEIRKLSYQALLNTFTGKNDGVIPEAGD
jgi:transglutaminase-like putative cysteine protease